MGNALAYHYTNGEFDKKKTSDQSLSPKAVKNNTKKDSSKKKKKDSSNKKKSPKKKVSKR